MKKLIFALGRTMGYDIVYSGHTRTYYVNKMLTIPQTGDIQSALNEYNIKYKMGG